MLIDEKELSAFMLDAGLLTRKDLEAATQEARESELTLEKVLLRKGHLTDRDLRQAASFILGIPFVNLVGSHIDFTAISLIPEPISREHKAIAYRRGENVLEVALLEPESIPIIKNILTPHKLTILPRLTDHESVKHGLSLYQDSLRHEFGKVIERESLLVRELSAGDLSDKELKEEAEDPHSSRILDALISHALLAKASHLHVEPEEKHLKIRYRIAGFLHDAILLPKHVAGRLSLRAKALANMNLRESLPQEGMVHIMGGDSLKTTLRLSIMPVRRDGEAVEKMVIRFVPEKASGFTLESLGLRGSALEALHALLEKKEGLILVSGPEKSGRTTFLYTALDTIHNRHRNIHSVEDPVEFALPGVNQTQVAKEMGLTFPRALRAAVRQDADVVMASLVSPGDKESAKILAAGGLTKLVLAGFTANSAAEAIHKFSQLSDKEILSSSLSASVSMRLVKRLGSNREKYFLNKDELKSLGRLVPLDKMKRILEEEGVIHRDTKWEDIPFWKAPRGRGPDAQERHVGGREKDKHNGFIGLFEVVPLTGVLRELVMKGAPASSIDEEARRHGAVTLLEDGILKAVQGLTTLEEVLRAAS